MVASRRSNWLAWAGLGLMSVQFGILARLTWWEYSWDIMEPVTYFVTYGTAMACYAYFVLTKEVSQIETTYSFTFSNKVRKNITRKNYLLTWRFPFKVFIYLLIVDFPEHAWFLFQDYLK